MSAATRYDTFARSLTERYATLPPRLQGIARFALDNADQMALATVAEVAQATGVPPSAVIRFAKALGFDGFLALQRVYRERLVARSATYRERIAALRRTGGRGGDVLPQLVDSAIAELEALRERVDPLLLRRAADLVLRAERVHVLAQRRAFPVAAYLAYALAQLEVPAILMDSIGGMLKQQAALLRRGDLLIAASFRSYSPEVVEAAQLCHRHHVPVVALTDHAVSPLGREATLRFDLGDNPTLPFRSLVGPMTAAQALVLAVGYAQAERPASAAPRRRPA
ncbi:MAG: MurR/RpiR family transcriptional regulator [Burkholderiales bacterium]|nr:MurR/RpiR family transcriptional regulator [Burkholderiales bacterium]GIK86185.1 MAG: sugar isomerase [Betaproteobacteria bacterium]